MLFAYICMLISYKKESRSFDLTILLMMAN